MGERTEELRREIETTRAGLGDTLDAIGDRVSPGRMIERRKNRMTGGVRSVLDRVMGTAQKVQHSVADVGQNATGAVREMPDTVRSQTEGAPMVAGAIALATGFLIAAAIPPSEKEKDVSSQLLDKAEPMKAELSSVGQEMAEHLKEPVQQAVQEVKSAAQDSADAVTSTARDAGQGAKDQVQQSVENVKSGESSDAVGSEDSTN
jgi:ElaB/YqjD/DUF883 family membrane-anchored ribosome-binding protein